MRDKLLTLSDRSNLNISYSGLITFESYQERLYYLSLWKHGYYSPRDIGQYFYHTKEWHQTRKEIIARDLGYDMGCNGISIDGKVIVHHILPIVEEDLDTWNVDILFNPDNLITVSLLTHNYIHYRQNELDILVERFPGDTKLW